MTTRLLLLTLFLVFNMHGMDQPRTIIKTNFQDSSLGKDLPLTASLQPIMNEQEIERLGRFIAKLTIDALQDVQEHNTLKTISRGGKLSLYVEQKNDHVFKVGLHCQDGKPQQQAIHQFLPKGHTLLTNWVALPHQTQICVNAREADKMQEQQEYVLNLDTLVQYTFDKHAQKLKRKIHTLIKNQLTNQQTNCLIEYTDFNS